MERLRCLGHYNDFQHLEADLGGLEHEFDLGFKFQEREDKYSIDPNTGAKLWADPYLALYVSVAAFDSPTGERKTLHYGLTRSKWEKVGASSHSDRDRLLKLARPRLTSDLQALRRGETPEALSDVALL